MSRKIKWTAEKYRIAIRGDDMPGLRSVVSGFDSASGYDLRKVDQWTASQKRRVRDYYNRVRALEAQEKVIVRPRNTTNLRKLQDAFHGDIGSKKFKVAFVPYTSPKPLPGAKRKSPKISYLESGISIDAGPYKRLFIPFNKRNLVKNPHAEIERVLQSMATAKLHFVQVGEYQTLNGRSPRLLTEQIINWMHQYDGNRALPRSSGNYGDSPKAHHYKHWLNGIVGYEFDPRIDRLAMHKAITTGMKAAKARRAAADKIMKSTRR